MEVPDQKGRNTITNLDHWSYEYDGEVLVTEQLRLIKNYYMKNAACWKHLACEG